MQIIKIPDKFKQCMKEMMKEHAVIFISAYAGMGKTVVIKELLKSRKISYSYISTSEEDFKEQVEDAKQRVLVIDDFQYIRAEDEEFLKTRFYEQIRKQKVIILSRAHMPAWLKPYQLIGQLGMIDKSALFFSEQEVQDFVRMNQIEINEEEGKEICYPLALKFMVVNLKNGELEDSNKRVLQDIFDYYDEVVVQNWNVELFSFLVQLGGFERFTLGLAAMVSGYSNVQRLIDEAYRVGAYLETVGEEYKIDPFFRRYLLYKQKRELSKAAINNIYYNAGLYYELRSDIKNALKYYSMCENPDKIKALLIRNSNMHPGVAQYLEVEEYYRAFPKDDILKTPELMCGMCMLCSLNMQVEESEVWYQHLTQYLQKLKKTDLEYKYVKGKLYWLDISLPHRGSANVETLIVNVFAKKKKQEFQLEDFSVTSNLPSILNGGKDFSKWVLRADALYALLKPMIPFVFGKGGEGIADLCFAEKMLEQANTDIYQIIHYINCGKHDAAVKGKLETEFVGAVLMQRIYLMQGNSEAAENVLKDFRDKVDEKKQKQLFLNVNSVIVGQELRLGKMERMEKWLKEESPNDNLRFNVFERYRYLVKARCYIACQKYTEGIALLNRLIQYGKMYDRTIIRIQARVLLAIIMYRMKDEKWKSIWEEALSEAQEYHFVRMIAEEGAAVLPLLQEAQTTLDKTYKKELMQYTKEEAMIHPSYLKGADGKTNTLTVTEKQVLKLLGRGMKNKEIAEFMNISLNTVGYHTKNIYQKLGINNRSQATNIAKSMEV